jgi:hypothetical protein
MVILILPRVKEDSLFRTRDISGRNSHNSQSVIETLIVFREADMNIKTIQNIMTDAMNHFNLAALCYILLVTIYWKMTCLRGVTGK